MAGSKISNTLTTLSSAAIFAIYAAGFHRTAPAAARFEAQAAQHVATMPLPAKPIAGLNMGLPGSYRPPAAAPAATATVVPEAQADRGFAVDTAEAAAIPVASLTVQPAINPESAALEAPPETPVLIAAAIEPAPAAAPVPEAPPAPAPESAPVAEAAAPATPVSPEVNADKPTEPASAPAATAPPAPEPAPAPAKVKKEKPAKPPKPAKQPKDAKVNVKPATPAANAAAPQPAQQPTQEAAQPADPAVPVLQDGTYTGWGTSRHGDIQAELVIAGGRIVSAKISDCETRYPCSFIDKAPGQVVERQSPAVDVVAGCTQSIYAFYYAVLEALSKAH